MDLNRGKFLFIPNYFCDFLIENKTENLQKDDFLKLGDSENELRKITCLLDSLISEDYLTEVDSSLLEGLKSAIPDRTNDTLIRDCILEISKFSDWSIPLFLAEINKIGVKFLEIRFLDFAAFEKHHKEIQLALEDHSIEFLHFLVPIHLQLKEIIVSEMKLFHRLNLLTIYNSKSQFEIEGVPFVLDFSSQSSIDHSNCGCIDPVHFNCNVLSYYDFKKTNSCLSHKLSIDQFGELKNCPSKKESFGKLSETDLERTILLDEFQKEWLITKDKILICSDCEFRWMCSDCRVFIQDESNPLSKPAKCGYNPYINKWINEEGYLPEESCGITYENDRLVVDEHFLEQVNQRIWE